MTRLPNNFKNCIMIPAPINSALIDEFIAAAIHEDVHDGDHTSQACIPADSRSRAVLKIKDYGVIAVDSYAADPG